jgi:hypothetical protein
MGRKEIEKKGGDGEKVKGRGERGRNMWRGED